jgi:hypothetical protein
MISLRTSVELIAVIEGNTEHIVNQIFVLFDLEHLIHPIHGKFTKDQKTIILLKELKYETKRGHLTASVRMDLLQHIVDHYYRHIDNYSEKMSDKEVLAQYDDRFSVRYPALAISLKRDGYIIKGRTITKMLPEEIHEAQIESELFSLLNNYNFGLAKSHLEQAISSHSLGNWAGANSQFRTFFEALLNGICNKLLPSHKCETASTAISLLGKTINPPFLLQELNEVESKGCNKPYIESLWKRLHPHGSHPGISDQEDSTFRYHTLIVMGHYLLKRLEKRLLN